MCVVGVQLQIWDTAGQERFRTITQSYYRSANGVIVAYDITRRSTFENCARWLEDVRRYAAPNVIQIIIGQYVTGLNALFQRCDVAVGTL